MTAHVPHEANKETNRDQQVAGRTEGPVSNLAEWVRRAAHTAPDRAALFEPGGSRLTWSELDVAVDAAAGALAAGGMIPGYRVALALPNCPEFAIAYFGALRAGLTVVPLDPANPAEQNARLAERVHARLVLDRRSAVDELVAREHRAPVLPPADPELVAVLLFTSGTSGEPRAAMLTHRALAANLEQLAAIDPPPARSDDLVLGVVPFCHVFGLNVVLGLAARTAATVLSVAHGDPARGLALLSEYPVTNVPAAPALLDAWSRDRSDGELAQAFDGVRLLLSGAAPLSQEAADRLRAATGLEVHEGYGLTESGAVTSTLCSIARKPGSVGAALPGVRLRVEHELVDATDDPGEVWVRGPNLFSGRWPDRSDGPDEDGWYATGDLGYLDTDGDLFLVDRDRELIYVAGFSVYPREIENVIIDLPGVAAAAVVGVSDSGQRASDAGEAVKAYVVPSNMNGMDGMDGIDGMADEAQRDDLAERVREHCRSRLARFKCPSVVQITDTLPRSVTGKDREAGAVMNRVVLYSKPGCHLCDDARQVIVRVCAELGVGWAEVDIQSDPGLFRKFGEQIPVTYVDGHQHDFWRVEEARLRSALAAPRPT